MYNSQPKIFILYIISFIDFHRKQPSLIDTAHELAAVFCCCFLLQQQEMILMSICTTTEQIPMRFLLLWDMKGEPEALKTKLHFKQDTNE